MPTPFKAVRLFLVSFFIRLNNICIVDSSAVHLLFFLSGAYRGGNVVAMLSLLSGLMKKSCILRKAGGCAIGYSSSSSRSLSFLIFFSAFSMRF
jgi:hypothetical protein